MSIQKLKWIWIVSLVLCSATTLAATTIGMSHPTVRNLERFVYLVENDLIDVEDLTLMGVLHAEQSDMIDAAKEFISSNNIEYIILELIGEPESIDSLFTNNSLSDDFERIFEKTDGFIFNGGADIPPSIYGEPTFLTTGILKPQRLWELSFMAHLIGGDRNPDMTPLIDKDPEYVVLGICLGMQQMNVATGGSMVQDIPFQLYGVTTYEAYASLPREQRHRNDTRLIRSLEDDEWGVHFHQIRVTDGSFLSNTKYTDSVEVLSSHHQALKAIGKGLKVVATSIDGKVAEAVQHTEYTNVYGIQFHPEVPEIYSPDERRIPGKEDYRISQETLDFHRELWADFSKRLREN
jgi:putative glutamine amidotransferase